MSFLHQLIYLMEAQLKGSEEWQKFCFNFEYLLSQLQPKVFLLQ